VSRLAGALTEFAHPHPDSVIAGSRPLGADAEKPAYFRVASLLRLRLEGAALNALARFSAVAEIETPISRRRFCAGACQAASGATLATLFTACGGSSPTSPSGGGSASPLGKLAGQFSGSTVRVNVSGSALADVGGAALIESVAGLFLISRTSANAFVAVDAVCTHEGCTITGANADGYVCPCHGSRYNRNGQVLAGPAKASLRQYATTFTDGIVAVTL
jgi:cytochrome b6-f complex iron-sulfur subunit